MERIFNGAGQHIANWKDGGLFTPSGRHVGRYVEEHAVFVDIYGKYIGEIVTNLSSQVKGQRLMRNEHSECLQWSFGGQGSIGSIGNLGSPGTVGSVGTLPGFSEVQLGS